MELNETKGRIESLKNKTTLTVQNLWDIFFFENFLLRLSKSKYKDYFVFKGGFLLQNIVGIESRTTMDIDLKVNSWQMDEKRLRDIIDDICNLSIDNIEYKLMDISNIKAVTKYGGKTARISAKYYNLKKIFSIDIGVGDVVTPSPINYEYKPIVAKDSFILYSYPIETILAEKIETTISKGTNNSRSKDLLDIYLLNKNGFDADMLNVALINTFNRRGTKFDYLLLNDMIDILFSSNDVRTLYSSYQNKHQFASNVSFDMCKEAINDIFSKLVFEEKISISDYGIELHLVRHGEYELNKVGGWTDDHLSSAGIKQIKSLKDLIDDKYDLFVSSDLVRAKESATILNEKLNMDIVYDNGFREINSGVLNNITIDEIRKSPSMWIDYTKLKMDEAFPEGDSPNSFFNRVKQAFINLISNNIGKKILLVTHSGVITVILCLINGYKYNNNLKIAPNVGEVVRIK